MKALIELPNNTQTLIDGIFTIGARRATNKRPVIKLSSFGKKTLATVTAMIQAYGFKSWNKAAS